MNIAHIYKHSRFNTFIEVEKDSIGTAQSRFKFLIWCLISVFSLITFRLADVAISGSRFIQRSPRAAQPLDIGRGNILDRHGRILATNVIVASLYANPAHIFHPRIAAKKLARTLSLSEKKVHTLLSSKKSFVWIARGLSPSQQQAVNALGIPGLYFQKDHKRVHPHKELTSHIVGLTDIDNIGLSGLEQLYNDSLLREAQPLSLTIDVRLQHILRQTLHKTQTKFSAIAANGILMDVRTGEILAMISLPDFDPHHVSSPKDTFNINSLGTYEMGSIMKILTFAMGFESKKITFDSGFDITGPYAIGKHKIQDFYPQEGWRSIPEIFMKSSNIGSIKIAQKVGSEYQRQFFNTLGFFDPLPVELPEKSLTQPPRKWDNISLASLSYGYGMATTPMHMLSAVSSVVNGGYYYPPTLIKKDTYKGRKVLSHKTSLMMRRLLYLSVKKGTGKKGDVCGYVVGGKTGSANKQYNGKYRKKGFHRASFISIFPMTEPKYALIVMVDEPKGIKETFGFSTGGWSAAPAAQEFVERAAPILKLPPIDEHSSYVQTAMNLDALLQHTHTPS